MVSVLDVARHAGVSAATVSRVLSGGATVAVETRARVMLSVEALGYRPNAIAQSLRRGRGRTVALVTGDIEQGIYPALAKAIQTTLGEVDLDVMLFDMAHSEERLAHLIERSASLGLRGILLAAPRRIRADNLLKLMRMSAEAGTLIMSVSQRLDQDGIVSIVPDDYAAAVGAVDHLLKRNREPIAYLGRVDTSAVGRVRYDGYRAALMAAKRTISETLRWDIPHGDRSEAGYATMTSVLQKGLRAAAVITASDEVALGAMAAAHDFGLRIPDDIAFVGFGGLRWGAHTRPALTTVSLDVDGLADAVSAAFKALDEEREVPLLTLVPSKLIVRGST